MLLERRLVYLRDFCLVQKHSSTISPHLPNPAQLRITSCQKQLSLGLRSTFMSQSHSLGLTDMIAHNDCKRRVMILKCEIRNHLILFKTKQKTIWQVFCSEEKKILIPKWIHLNDTVIIFQTSTEKQLRICYFKTREHMSNQKQSKICLLVSVGGLRAFTFNTAFFFSSFTRVRFFRTQVVLLVIYCN